MGADKCVEEKDLMATRCVLQGIKKHLCIICVEVNRERIRLENV